MNNLKTKFYELLQADDINDNSKYPNANKGGEFKSVETLVQELFSEQQEQLGFSLLEDYLPPDHKDLIYDLLRLGDLYMHDRTKIALPYCASLDLSRLLHETTNYGRLKTSPVKRVDSYISAVGDTVTQFCFYLAGAIGLGTFFMDIGELIKDRHQWTLDELKTDTTKRKYLENEFQQLIHTLNYYSRGTESAFTNISIFDESILQSMEIDAELIPYIIESQKVFLEFFDKGDPLTDGLPYTFPIITINTSTVFSDFIQWVSKLDFVRYNFFLSKEAKFAMCCRYQSNTELMKELGGYANSFGASPATIGSHRVVTINFNSLALQAESLADYYNLVQERTTQATILLRAHKSLIEDLTKAGVQSLITEGWLNPNRLFSTIGVIGLPEAQETIERRFGYSDDYIKKTLVLLNELVYPLSTRFNLVINIEQIPGESARFTLCRKDKQRFGEENVPYTFYANQFSPLTEDGISIFEKIDIEGSYYDDLTGGGIAHLRCPDRPTSQQFLSILNYALERGCGHIAFSSVFSICKDNHSSIGKHDYCPQCGAVIVDYLERIVGYHQRVQAWGAKARELDFHARKFLN